MSRLQGEQAGKERGANQVEIIKPEEYAVSEWAGGKTTQLYIYPQDSEYAKRNFLLRISSATVECERSEFTSLPQVERIILPLSGSLHLFYEGHGEKKLEPFEQDRFDGGWKTVSVGRATDFNVMLREGTQAQVRLLDVNPNEQASVEVAANGLTAVFAAQGTAVVDGKALPERGLAVAKEEGSFLLTGGSAGCRLLCVEVQWRLPSILTRKKRAGMSSFFIDK